MTTALLIAALFMGFFGSPHCLGMCGGLVTAFSLIDEGCQPSQAPRSCLYLSFWPSEQLCTVRSAGRIYRYDGVRAFS